MLVHICCSVDSHYFLSRLREAYPDEKLIGFFYNPNIHPKSEHDLRLADVRRSCEMLGIELLEGEYDTGFWFEGVRGLEEEPEKGERCVKCFDIRLMRTGAESKRLAERRFTTTLLSSPMKEQERLFIEGERIAAHYGLEFVKINVRANGGVQKQNELAKKDNLYRQNYCGCKFALTKQREKQGKSMLEMMSDISGKALLGSIEERQEVFAHRDGLESAQMPYILTQRRYQVYRNLRCLVSDERGEAIESYALVNSMSKKHTKIEQILWVKPKLTLEENLLELYLRAPVCIGYSKRDDSVFVPLAFVNLILGRVDSTIKDLRRNPPSLEEEIRLRELICGHQSLNSMVIVAHEIHEPISLEILSLSQEENIFRVIEVF